MGRLLFTRAWRSTIRFFGGWSLLGGVALVPAVGFLLHWEKAGMSAMMEEVNIWIIYGLIAPAIVFVLVFVFNLSCTPYRIEKDRRIQAEQNQINRTSAESMKKIVSARDYFTIAEAARLLTGEKISDSPLDGASALIKKDIDKMIIDEEIETSGDFGLAITTAKLAKIMPSHSEPSLPGFVTLDRNTVSYLARKYNVSIPGLTTSVTPSRPKPLGTAT